MKRAVLLCLLLAACDRANDEGSSNKAESTRANGSGRAVSTQDAAVRLREKITAADADPEIQRLRPGAEEEIAYRNSVTNGNFRIFDNPPQVGALLDYYVTHHPEAGLAWVLSQRGVQGLDRRADFAEALYTRDREMAYQFLARVPAGGLRLDYLRGLATAADEADDSGRLWQEAGGDSAACDPEVLESLIRGDSKTAPIDLWVRVSARPGSEMTPEEFVGIIRISSKSYPTELLAQVPADRQLKIASRALRAGGSPKLITWAAEWLEARPPAVEYDEGNAGLALKYGQRGEKEVALRAAGRITHAEERQRVLDQLPGL